MQCEVYYLLYNIYKLGPIFSKYSPAGGSRLDMPYMDWALVHTQKLSLLPSRFIVEGPFTDG